MICNKGPGRPRQQIDRTNAISGLIDVDYVFINDFPADYVVKSLQQVLLKEEFSK